MAARKMTDSLIKREAIKEEIRLINGSETDYVTPSGNIYKDYGNGMFFHKKTFINNKNGYLYTGITYPEGNRQRRVHILVAKAYIPNPNNYPYVMHKDNNKANPNVDNLEWGTASKNTKDAYKDGLAKNDKSWNDSQSQAVCQFNMEQKLLSTYGSVKEASRETGITASGIIYQCKHNVKTKPRCGYYFRYYDEYKLNGFVL